jgi:hypothetical protein
MRHSCNNNTIILLLIENAEIYKYQKILNKQLTQKCVIIS